MFTTSTHSYTFTSGMLAEHQVTRPSELMAPVQALNTLVQGVVAIPGSILKLRLDYTNATDSLVKSRTQLATDRANFTTAAVQAKMQLDTAQAALITSQYAIPQAALNGQTALANGTASLSTAQAAVVTGQFASQQAYINAQTSLQQARQTLDKLIASMSASERRRRQRLVHEPAGRACGRERCRRRSPRSGAFDRKPALKGVDHGGRRSRATARFYLDDLKNELELVHGASAEDRALEDFIVEAVLGAGWYQAKLTIARRRIRGYIVLNVLLVIALPVGVALMGKIPGMTQVSAAARDSPQSSPACSDCKKPCLPGMHHSNATRPGTSRQRILRPFTIGSFSAGAAA